MTDAPPAVSNEHIAELLERVAVELEEQRANPYRIDAYRAAARVVRAHGQTSSSATEAAEPGSDSVTAGSAGARATERPDSRPSSSIQELALAGGRKSLAELPHIGASLASAIEEIARSGRLRLLDRLEGGESPFDGLTRVPGIGEKLAQRIRRELHVDTLEGLLAAARDGRLAGLEGFGPRRVEAIRTLTKKLLERSPRRARWHAVATNDFDTEPREQHALRVRDTATVPDLRDAGGSAGGASPAGAGGSAHDENSASAGSATEFGAAKSAEDTLETTASRAEAGNPAPAPENTASPSIALLLDLDRRYRELSAAGDLPKIAPTRNNPERKAWLPVWHTNADGWHVTALFSNTDRAHELGRTDDWVVLYYESSDHEDQCTVVTEVKGKLAGRRVVRGRESECGEHYLWLAEESSP